jgi:two-component system LytT family response regulator
MTPAIIIDDEPHAVQSLAALLELYCPEVEVVGRANSVTAGLDLLRRLSPKLVFLDIHIGEETGFELLEQLKEADFQLIFTTAHSDYAIRAFRYNAIDYLLKPVDPAELQRAVQKALEKNAPRLDAAQVAQLLQSLSGRSPEKLTIASAEGYHLAEIDQIVRIQGEGNYSTFYLQNGERIVASKNLKSYEELLPADRFIKVHQSHLVNLECISKLLFEDGGHLLMTDGSRTPLARRRREAVMAALKIR